MAAWFNDFLNILFPARCAGCGEDGEWWCEGCRRSVTPRTLCYDSPGLEGVLAATFYGDPVAKGLKSLKYGHARAIAPSLAEYLLPILPPVTDPVLIPVPLHQSRLRQRGHNQAVLLVTAVAAKTGFSLDCSLKRVRRTETQTKLNKPLREANVSGAFRWVGNSLRGRSVILIDDVTTTGATFSACATALKSAEPAGIYGVAVAKKR